MGLLQKAAETYDNFVQLVGEYQEDRDPLAPIGHLTKTAQIEITLTDRGEFVKAVPLGKKVIFPVTIESAGRTGTAAAETPHPLVDKIFFLLPENVVGHEAYIAQLTEWCNSKFGNDKIRAVLEYVKAGTIREDLEGIEGVEELIDEKGTPTVAWRVTENPETENDEDALWKDKAVMKSFTDFYLDKLSTREKGVCYVTGELVPISELHAKNIVSTSANAKIISTNRSLDFAYKGLFLDAKEALTVGYETSQKAHNVLKWLVENDGVHAGNKVFICWSPQGTAPPQPITEPAPDTADAEAEGTLDGTRESKMPTRYKSWLNAVFDGYRRGIKLEDEADLVLEDDIVVASFEAAISGRLAVTYYNEMRASDLLKRLQYWDETCSWYSGYWGTTSPSLRGIVDAAFGLVRSDDKNAKFEVDDKVRAMQMQRLMLCRIEQAAFPTDIMRSAVKQCGNLRLVHRFVAEKKLLATCAIIRKYRYDRFKEEWTMTLDPDRKDRSYQFGRLLAVMDKIEKDACDEPERTTNAMRLQATFLHRPAYASQIIIEKLKRGYYRRLRPGLATMWEKMIGEIMENIQQADDPAMIDKPLTETYLLGYYSQKNALYIKKNNKKNVEEENDEND